MKDIRNVAIVFHGLAPYRSTLYDFIQDTLTVGGNQFHVIAGEGQSGLHPWKEKSLMPKRAPFARVKTRLLNFPVRTLIPRLDLWRALTTLNPSLVWVHEFSPFSLMALAWAIAHNRPKIVSTEIGDEFAALDDYRGLTWAQRCNQEFILRLADGVIACTPQAQTRAERLKKQCLLAPHAVDTEFFKPKSERSGSPVVRFIQVGSYIRRKGGHLLLQAFARAVAHQPHISLCVLGGGDAKELKCQARDLGVENSVEFLPFGNAQETLSEYQRSDVFVLASLADTYGVVTHEAAACGLPLLVSKFAGASRILLANEKAGLTFDPNSIDETAAKIILLAENSELRSRYATAARLIAEQYCVRRVAHNIVTWIGSLYS